ncbi:MAG TPA: GPW/gp25 family protein [Solirubrobacteraceae bacterium]|nr:GPW/gp25 family protein [Solirubrobacteraceae bacterium]
MTAATERPVGLAFPFAVAPSGRIAVAGGDERMRGRILQVLFTTPGERVNLPDFGCGLFNLVFEPADPVVAAAMEFTVGQALMRWLGDEILVDAVEVRSLGETVEVEVAWTSRADRARSAMRVEFR